MTQENRVTAAIVVIGDEILSGRTKDRNIGFIAENLTMAGIDLEEVRIVPDKTGRIVEAVNTLRARYTYVFTTGGIGPTHDDITADAIAKAFNVPIDIDERALAIMRRHYTPAQINKETIRMARIPQGAQLVQNPVSHCPGFWLDNVIVMAGVPKIMQVMLDDVLPKLRTSRPVRSLSIRVELPENEIAGLLREIQEDFRDVSMGSYPFYGEGQHGTFIVCRSPDRFRLAEVEAEIQVRLADLQDF